MNQLATETPTKHIHHNAVVIDALSVARAATQALNNDGVCVIAAMANGRQPLLMVDRIPDGLSSVVKRQHPNGYGGTTYVRAASAFGCQLEAMSDEYPDGHPLSPVQQSRGALEHAHA